MCRGTLGDNRKLKEQIKAIVVCVYVFLCCKKKVGTGAVPGSFKPGRTPGLPPTAKGGGEGGTLGATSSLPPIFGVGDTIHNGQLCDTVHWWGTL